MDLAIFGAQGIALGAYEAIHNLYPRRNICCFLVTARGENPRFCAGLPVQELASFSEQLSACEKEKTEVLIATPEDVMPVIEQSLEACGFFCHTRLTSLRWANLMGYHYAHGGVYVPLSALPVGFHRAKLHMFMAKFYKDKPLTADYRLPQWVTPVQAGAVLCEERVADILDCDGENISHKNGNYSELTVLYWIWKNRLQGLPFKETSEEQEYYGLSHYRRILELTEDDVLRLWDNDIDAVLPYPMPYEPNIHVHHKRYLKSSDWDAMLTALKELQPEYAEAFPAVLAQRYLYNYNIILAKKNVLNDYCAWLFPILARTEELSIPKGSERKDRYIGYMGETLETLYFMKQSGKLNLAHAGCRLLT